MYNIRQVEVQVRHSQDMDTPPNYNPLNVSDRHINEFAFRID